MSVNKFLLTREPREMQRIGQSMLLMVLIEACLVDHDFILLFSFSTGINFRFF